MKKKYSIFIILLLIGTIPVSASTIDTNTFYGKNYLNIFSEFYDTVSSNDFIISYTNKSDYFTSINQGLAMVTLLRLYDLFDSDVFLQRALALSDIIGTYFIDLRYDLVASYYNVETDVISNYRNLIDNLFVAWGLKQLDNALNNSYLIEKQAQSDRIAYISRSLNTFDYGSQFLDSYRVDLGSSKPVFFRTYSNLMAAYIISLEKDLFSGLYNTVFDVYNFIKANLTSSKGGVYTLYKGGFHDNIITTKNTALFISLAMNLYDITGDIQYFEDAKKSMSYILTYVIANISIKLSKILIELDAEVPCLVIVE